MLRRPEKPCKSRRRNRRRLRSEQLERRDLLAYVGVGDVVQIDFDTTLESLDLSGGPFPMPLASDPSNASFPDTGGGIAPDGGPASVDGYGFVDSTVTVTLSSQRAVSPGDPTVGEAHAFLQRGEQVAFNGGGGGPGAAIDPEELDGQQFFVDSFFDVFFDITVTDVDSRPGRDYAGMPDGATIVLQDQGPGRLESVYLAEFQKDVPNFGLVPPPPEASRPYVGHFDIVIPLPGDVNGNGITPDYLKFTLASHLAGAATYIELPDGTVIDQFDSTASILGAVSDDLADPPFSIGSVLDPSSCVPGVPTFPGAPDPCTPIGPGLSGPTVATSTLLTPVVTKDPGSPYVDANNDALFNPADGDVLLDDGELNDGFFDTAIPEGPDYTVAIPGAGLRIHGAAISNLGLNFAADGGMTVNTDLTATNQNLLLTSRADDVELDDPTLHARNLLEINAAIDIVSEDDVLRASGSESVIRLWAGEDILLTGTQVTAMKEVDMDAGIFIIIHPSVANPATVTATPNIFGKVTMDALGIDVADSQINANRDIIIDATGALLAQRSQMSAGQYAPGTINLHALDFVNLEDAQINARNQITITSTIDMVHAVGATIQASPTGNSSVGILADTTISLDGATVSAARTVEIVSISGDILAPGSTLTAAPNLFGRVALAALGTIDVDGATITAERTVSLNAGPGSILTGVGATMTANRDTVNLVGAGSIDVSSSSISARKGVSISASFDVFAFGATIQATPVGDSSVLISALSVVDVSAATLSAGGAVNVSAGTAIGAAFSTLTATPHYLGNVALTAPGGPIDVSFATIDATREIDIAAGGDLFGDFSVMNAKGHSQGQIGLNSGGNMFLFGAILNARKIVDLEAVDSIFAADAKLLAQGAVFSEVRATAGVDLILTDAVIRARQLIDLRAGGLADLTRSSIGITHLGSGDICVTAATIDVTDAVLRAPDLIKLLGTVIGIPTDISTGFLSPVSC